MSSDTRNADPRSAKHHSSGGCCHGSAVTRSLFFLDLGSHHVDLVFTEIHCLSPTNCTTLHLFRTSDPSPSEISSLFTNREVPYSKLASVDIELDYNLASI